MKCLPYLGCLINNRLDPMAIAVHLSQTTELTILALPNTLTDRDPVCPGCIHNCNERYFLPVADATVQLGPSLGLSLWLVSVPSC